jgi:peptide/nickel transport system substrate-binding protein
LRLPAVLRLRGFAATLRMTIVRRFAPAMLLLLVACGARSAETRDPDMIVCAWIAGPPGFNPYTSVSSSALMADDMLYSRLVDIGPDLNAQWKTSLAYRVDVTNGGTRYLVHLRRNVRWTDGQPLSADDVVFSVELDANPLMIEGNGPDFALMRSIRALDRYTVEVRLAHPSPPFLLDSLGADLWIVPKRVLGKYPASSPQEAQFVNTDAAFASDPVTSGPWRIERNVPDAYLILERSPSYWGPKPQMRRIAFRVYPEQDSLYAAVDAGEVDVTGIPPNLWRIRERLSGDHRFVTWPWNVTFLLLPNYRSPEIAPFVHDRTVRQAMLYAIDRAFITKGIMSGQADVLNGPLPSFSPYYNPHVPRYTYDPARARAMLEADGWHLQGPYRYKNGHELHLTLKTGGATDAVASDVAELIQANLRAVGIDCSLENEELQTFFSDVHASRFEYALRGNVLPPYPNDYKLYDSKATRANGGYNLGYYDNPAVDDAIERAQTGATPAQARLALDRYQMLAARDAMVIFLYSVRLGAVVPPRLRGYQLSPINAAALPDGEQFWRLTK